MITIWLVFGQDLAGIHQYSVGISHELPEIVIQPYLRGGGTLSNVTMTLIPILNFFRSAVEACFLPVRDGDGMGIHRKSAVCIFIITFVQYLSIV